VRRSAALFTLLIALSTPWSALAQESGAELPAEVPETAEGTAGDDRPRWAKEPWEKIRFGLKAGASWSNLRGELPIPEVGTFGFKGDFGFAAGIAFEIPFDRIFSLQPELLIIRKFAEIDLAGTDYGGTEKLSANYFEIPLLFKWYPGPRRGVIGTVTAGPTLSVRMDAFRESRTPEGNIEDVEGKGLVKASDWGVTVGGGFEFHEFLWALTVDVRYTHGFGNVDNSGSGAQARWSTIYAMAGIIW